MLLRHWALNPAALTEVIRVGGDRDRKTVGRAERKKKKGGRQKRERNKGNGERRG